MVRSVSQTLVLFAFFLQALIPVGFMPDFQSGKTALVICSGLDAKTVFIDTGHAPDEKQDTDTHKDICLFASFTPYTALPGSTVVILIAVIFNLAFSAELPQRHGPTTLRLPPPTGPPERL